MLVLGKELRRDPDRGMRELRARAAAASVALRAGARVAVALEAPLAGQQEAGSALVGRAWTELGISTDRTRLAERTRSTREEAIEAARLVEEEGWRRLLVVTSAYHVARARRYFEDVFDPGRVAVHAPEALLFRANPMERAWILAGTPGPAARAAEAPVEWALRAFAAVLSPLPDPLRWRIEIRAGAALRMAPGSGA